MKPGPFFLKKKKSGVPKKGPGDLSYVLRPQSAVPKKGPGSYVRSPQSYVRSPQSGGFLSVGLSIRRRTIH